MGLSSILLPIHVAHELPSNCYTEYRDQMQRKAPDTLRGYLIDNKYFARNPCVMNILQTPTSCKPLNPRILRPRYPPRGEGVPPSRNDANKNPRSSKRTRTSGKPACTGYPPAASRKSGKSANDALTTANTRQRPVQSQRQARRGSASRDRNPGSQFSASFNPSNASKKVPL
jgi:hypothetical protein